MGDCKSVKIKNARHKRITNEKKLKGFGERTPVGSRPGARAPCSPPLNPALGRWADRSTHANGVGERDGDGERQSLWNGDHQDGDGDDEEVNEVLDVAVVPRKLLYGELLHAQVNDEDDERQDCHRRACVRSTRTTSQARFFVAYQNLASRCLVCNCKHGSHVINIPKADWYSVKNKQLTATPC